MKRHEDALGIQEGACNLRAIAGSLVVAADEAGREGVGAEQDAAVRMIVHRLARICRVDAVSYGYDTETLAETHSMLVRECRSKAGTVTAAPMAVEAALIMLRAARGGEPTRSIEG